MGLALDAREPAAEQAIALAEFRLGFRLPSAYRNWLKISNGAGTRQATTIPGTAGIGYFSDLAPVERLPSLRRDAATHVVPASYLVISLEAGSAVAIKAKGDGAGSVWWADLEQARHLGISDSDQSIMIRLADDWYSFLNLDFGGVADPRTGPEADLDYFILWPEPAATPEPSSVIDSRTRPPIVHDLHCLIDDLWHGDELLQCFPTYVISGRLAELLHRSGAGSFEIREARISFTAEVVGRLDGRMPPIFRHLHVTGLAGRAPIGINPQGLLVVSGAALGLLQVGRLAGCYAELYSAPADGRDPNAVTSQVLTSNGEFQLMIDSNRDRSFFHERLSQLEGELEDALSLAHMPMPKWPEDLTDADWEQMGPSYLQCAGSAHAMTCEISMVTNGVQRLFTIGRPGPKIGRPSVTISTSGPTLDVYPSEVFEAAEAAELFYSYHRTRSIPAGYELRHIGP